LRHRLGEQVADLILTAIRLHEFMPGARLPSETELCAQLGVNRMAVREGLRWLEDHKYIRMQRGRYGGAFVLDPEIDVVMDRLAGKGADLRQLFEYRTAVEPLVAALAAERISQDELSRLDALHAEELQEPSVARTGFVQSMWRSIRSLRRRVETPIWSMLCKTFASSWRLGWICSRLQMTAGISPSSVMANFSTASKLMTLPGRAPLCAFTLTLPRAR
jgi:DNA-binding transcriptional regulator YhcF (GntR family)